MSTLGIQILRNGVEVSVRGLKSEVRDALLSHIEEQLIQHYEFDNPDKEYQAIVSYEPGKRTFKLTYDKDEDKNGAVIQSFKFKELDDYLGVYGGKTYTAEIVSTYEGGRRKTRRRRRRV